jgi:predicted transcriptional regulator
MAVRTTTSLRITKAAQRPLRLLAAFEDRTEGAVIEDALAAYLQIRSLGYSGVLPEARQLAHTTPEDVGDTVARLTAAIERTPGEANQRLRERSKQRAT